MTNPSSPSEKQVILGAGGAIGTEIAKSLPEYTKEIRLVSRNPEKVNPTDEVMSVDLLDQANVIEAVEGTTVAYLTAGLKYDVKVWQTSWPKIMSNVIDACKKHNCKLVFFDNIYMYDPGYLSNLTEETPMNPSSEKGKVRAQLVKMIMDEIEDGALTALIARSADYYGPNTENTSVLTETVIKPLRQGKKANWMASANFKHSYTYTPDAGKATALLGNTANAYNQVWHLPTAQNPLTGKEWVEAIANEMGVQPKYRNVPKFLIRLMGFFDPVMREMVEMMYQYDRDYIFRSDKFQQFFDFAPTPYSDGIKTTVQYEQSRGA